MGPVASVPLGGKNQEGPKQVKRDESAILLKRKCLLPRRELELQGDGETRGLKKRWEKGIEWELKKGRYYHIMPNIGSWDEVGGEEDDETEEQHKSKKETLTMLTADSGAIDCYCRELSAAMGALLARPLVGLGQ